VLDATGIMPSASNT